ncbi:MAG: cytochrome P450 [Pseudomonadota bacterium]
MPKTAKKAELKTVDLFTDDVQSEPFSTYSFLLSEAPLAVDSRYGNYVLTRHADVRMLADNAWLSAADGVDPAGRFPPGTYPDIERTDPPRHRRLRSLLLKPFSARTTAGWRDEVSAIFDEYFARITKDRFDVVDAVCYPAPADVICSIMGFPAERRSDYRRWSRALMNRLGQALSDDDRNSLIEMARFMREQVALRRAEPSSDLLSRLIEAEVDGERLSDDELVAHGVFLLAAGHETTTNLLSSIVFLFTQHPELYARLDADRDAIDAFVEEALRLEAPIQSMCRTSLEEREVHGAEIPNNARVLFSLGASGRDETVFAEPDEIDLERRNCTRHLAFGYGNHLCLGAPLARLEARLFVEGLLDRFSSILATGNEERWASTVVRGFHHLVIQVERR